MPWDHGIIPVYIFKKEVWTKIINSWISKVNYQGCYLLLRVGLGGIALCKDNEELSGWGI